MVGAWSGLSYRKARVLGEIMADVASIAARSVVKRHHDECCAWRAEPISAIPFADQQIPDEQLARVIEAIEGDEPLSLWDLAQRFGYPPSLLHRELTRYGQRFQRWLQIQLA